LSKNLTQISVDGSIVLSQLNLSFTYVK